ALAQGVVAPAPGAVGVPSAPQGAATPAAAAPAQAEQLAMPAPAAAEHRTKDSGCPEDGEDVSPEDAHAKRRRVPLEASWDNGLRLESADDQFQLHVGGIAQVDTVWLIGPQSVFALPGGGSNGVGNAQATQLRRAILE